MCIVVVLTLKCIVTFIFFFSLSHTSRCDARRPDKARSKVNISRAARADTRGVGRRTTHLSTFPPPQCPQRVLSPDVITWPARQTLTTADLLHDNLLSCWLPTTVCVSEWRSNYSKNEMRIIDHHLHGRYLHKLLSQQSWLFAAFTKIREWWALNTGWCRLAGVDFVIRQIV